MMNRKNARITASCIVLSMILIVLSSCTAFNIPGVGIGGNENTAAGCYVGGKRVEMLSPESESLSYKKMGETQKTVYSAAYTALSNGYNVFVLKNVDYEEILEVYGKALSAFLYDYPEYFWLNGYVKADAEYQVGSKNGNVTLTLGLYEYWEKNDLEEARRTFSTALISFLNDAREIEGDFEKVKYVHDRIIDSTEYDDESYLLGNEVDAESDAFSNSAYGPLIQGSALCGGYAKLFGLIMHRLGYECEYITGTADGGPHAWNLLKLDDEYYHIDLTWDDPDSENGIRLYNYFCVNDDLISKTHTVDDEYKSLSATGEKYNYHIFKSLYLEEYDYSSVSKMIADNMNEGYASIRFETENALNAAYRELVEEYKLYEILAEIGKENYSYMVDEELLTLMFIFE